MFYEITPKGCLLKVRVSPNASKCAVCGMFTDSGGQDFLKISLISIPEKGKANLELIKFLSRLLGIAKSRFLLISGETDRYKKILLTPPVSEEVLQVIKKLEQSS